MRFGRGIFGAIELMEESSCASGGGSVGGGGGGGAASASFLDFFFVFDLYFDFSRFSQHFLRNLILERRSLDG